MEMDLICDITEIGWLLCLLYNSLEEGQSNQEDAEFRFLPDKYWIRLLGLRHFLVLWLDCVQAILTEREVVETC